MVSQKSPQRWIFTSMAGAMFIIVTQLATRSDLNAAHHLAINCFAFALPICCGTFVDWTDEERDKYPLPETGEIIKFYLVVLVFFIGALGFFLSFGAPAGVAFVAGTIIATINW